MKKVIKYSTKTPLSIDISPHGGEKVRCKTGGFDETNEFYSTLAPLYLRGALDRVKGREIYYFSN